MKRCGLRSRTASARRAVLLLVLGALALGVAAVPVAAEEEGECPVVATIRGDWDGVSEKLESLAEAIPEDDYGWTPAEGVRTVGEVVLHVVGPNLALGQQLLGGEAEGDDPLAALGENPTKKQILGALRASIERVDQAFAGLSEADLGKSYQAFGREMSGYRIVNILTSHAHEHLGQLIAYGRSNGVVPPWSK